VNGELLDIADALKPADVETVDDVAVVATEIGRVVIEGAAYVRCVPVSSVDIGIAPNGCPGNGGRGCRN
jgi:hypothetical protein